MTALNVAVLGVGNRAQDHLRTLSRLEGLCRLVAVCDADPARAAQVGAAYGVPGFADLEQMLAEVAPTLLYVITPPDSHHAAVEVAARHGVHIVCETPIAPTLPLADALIAAAQRHGVKLEIAENVWRWPNERLKRQIVEAGLIGQVTQMHLWYYSGSYHGISAARTLIGSAPTRVSGFARETPIPAHQDRLGRFHTSGRYELGLVEFAGGAICVYQFPLFPHYRNAWDVVGSEGALVGSDLVLVRDGERQVFPIRQELDESSDVPALVRVYVETDPPIVWENPYRGYPLGVGPDEIGRADILAGMRRAILDDTAPAYGAANARADQEVLIALRESAARDGAWVALPLAEVTTAERELHDEYARRYGHDPLGDIQAVIRTHHPRNTPAELARLRYDEDVSATR